jgi:hypothetical protein
MLSVAQVVAVILVSIAMGPALAHALELSGKMRLTREAYLAVQTIYYPGFTIAGIAEPLSLIAAIFLLFLTPARSADFWLTLLALVGLIGMQAVYWFVTHPVNRRWIQGEQLSGLGAGFSRSPRRTGPAVTAKPVHRIGRNCVTGGSIRTWCGRCLRCSA